MQKGLVIVSRGAFSLYNDKNTLNGYEYINKSYGFMRYSDFSRQR